MIKTILSDLSYVLIFPRDKNYHDELNHLYASVGVESDFEFSEYFVVNKALFTFYQNLKKFYQLAMYTSGKLQNAPEINPIVNQTFEVVFSASEMKNSKRNPDSYVEIAKILKRKTSEIIFIDDMKANIEAAKKSGMQTVQFQSNANLIISLQETLKFLPK